MKRDSAIFDRIRIKKGEKAAQAESLPRCEHPGLRADRPPSRTQRARTGKDEYWNFCLEHVRAYNLSYNYFAGMPDEAVASYPKIGGHRPPAHLDHGRAGLARGFGRRAGGELLGRFWARWAEADPAGLSDPFGFSGGCSPKPPPPNLRNAERKAFGVLNLEITANAKEIKLRYKEMVKSFHPDANGGDRAFEDKLREIIQAYSHLKSAGFC